MASDLPGHTSVHHDRVNIVLQEFFNSLEKSRGSRSNLLLAVRVLFSALKDINEDAGGSLLETDEREIIVPSIREALSEMGMDISEFEGGDPTYYFRDF